MFSGDGRALPRPEKKEENEEKGTNTALLPPQLPPFPQQKHFFPRLPSERTKTFPCVLFNLRPSPSPLLQTHTHIQSSPFFPPLSMVVVVGGRQGISSKKSNSCVGNGTICVRIWLEVPSLSSCPISHLLSSFWRPSVCWLACPPPSVRMQCGIPSLFLSFLPTQLDTRGVEGKKGKPGGGHDAAGQTFAKRLTCLFVPYGETHSLAALLCGCVLTPDFVESRARQGRRRRRTSKSSPPPHTNDASPPLCLN